MIVSGLQLLSFGRQLVNFPEQNIFPTVAPLKLEYVINPVFLLPPQVSRLVKLLWLRGFSTRHINHGYTMREKKY